MTDTDRITPMGLVKTPCLAGWPILRHTPRLRPRLNSGSPIMRFADSNREASGNDAGGFPSISRNDKTHENLLLGSSTNSSASRLRDRQVNHQATQEDSVVKPWGSTRNSRYGYFLLRIKICRCRFSNPPVQEFPQLCPNVPRVYCFARGTSHRRRHVSLRSYPH